MACAVSFYQQLTECPETLRVHAGLTNGEDISWVINDKHGNQYIGAATVASDGSFDIDATDADIFPEGLFNASAGRFTLEVYGDYPYNSDKKDLTFCAAPYDSVIFDFVKKTSSVDASVQHLICNP